MYALVTALVALGTGAPAAETARITMDPTAERGRLNPLIFGHNQLGYDTNDYKGGKGPLQHDAYRNYGAGVWDPRRRCANPKLLELLREAGATLNRWPGGCGAPWHDFSTRTPQDAGHQVEYLNAPVSLDEWRQPHRCVPV